MLTVTVDGPAIRRARELGAGLQLKPFHTKIKRAFGPVGIDHLRKIEQGVSQPSAELFAAICQVLGRDGSELSRPRTCTCVCTCTAGAA